jgi:hypothetical protein
VHPTFRPVPVATMAPLLRLVLLLLLMLAVLAGVLVASNSQIGWLALAFVVVAGPVAVVVDGRSRSRSGHAATPRVSPERARETALGAWEPA